MISLAKFRSNLYVTFKLMVESNATFEVVYKGKVYEVVANELQKQPALKRRKRAYTPQVRAIETEHCEECSSISFNGVCMSKECSSNSTPSHR